ncbi:glucarate dehydratase [Agromyces sp. Root81]|uniref:enolase C-terminal domain-like protein n=1 Tax=Agromyces sp. Root81 TaxID=1736601 RepID=UPI0006FB1E0E|nr:enolase C-terminal domain-like protein [Agromyces sp. Root81]KRC59220.1 glucarate dehydratase [Agromyces sp. Root81]
MSRISAVEVIPLAFRDPALLNTVGVHEPLALRTLVKLRLDDGTIGLGETIGELSVIEDLRRIAPRIIGMRVDDRSSLTDAIVAELGDPASHRTMRACSPINVAAYDAHGRLEGVPVAELLGGRVRDEVDFAAYLFYKWAGHPGEPADRWGAALDPVGVVAQARMLIDEYGFRSIKLKGGVFEPGQEVAAVQALAQAFPGVPLRLDPNAGWSVPTSIEVAVALDGVLEYLEDPAPGVHAMAQVRAQAPMPLATNMIGTTWPEFDEMVELGGVDIVLADHHMWGGLDATRELAARCGAAGLGVSMHSNSHLGVSLAAMVHVAAATPELDHACDTHYPWNSDDEIVDLGDIAFSGGAVRVPDAPGLGVELRDDVVDRLHRQYLESGRTVRDDTGYMRTFDPAFDPSPARF